MNLTRLGPYDILSPLGAGGFGEVYKARDTRLDRTVAIRILPSADPELKARFERPERVKRLKNDDFQVCHIEQTVHVRRASVAPA
jgi:serine/threonine protein kinase